MAVAAAAAPLKRGYLKREMAASAAIYRRSFAVLLTLEEIYRISQGMKSHKKGRIPLTTNVGERD